jgi:DNA modification methylase
MLWKRLLHDGQKINLLLTDPPYWIDYVESKKWFTGTTEKFEDIPQDGIQSDREYAEFTRDWIKPMLPYFAEKNASYIFNADKMIFALREWILQAGMRFTQLLIWSKTQQLLVVSTIFLNTNSLPTDGMENMLLWWKSKEYSAFCESQEKHNPSYDEANPTPPRTYPQFQ